MSDAVVTEVEKPLSELEIFLVKVGAVAVAVLVVGLLIVYWVEGVIERRTEALKGGNAFWSQVERKLYALADEPDLPAAKKEKIVAALKKLSIKYQPYFEALNGTSPKSRD